jgi:hypothetical protein
MMRGVHEKNYYRIRTEMRAHPRTHTRTHTHVYIYIYIEREREREREIVTC